MTTVTVIVPAYNEGGAFASALVTLADYFAMHRSGGYEFRYVIVDDGSCDDTYTGAESFARWRKDVVVLRHVVNRGLGAALRTALDAIDTEVAVVLDADLSYSPATAMHLIEALEREGADVALASPYMHGGSVVNVPPLRRALSREANRMLSLAVGGRYATLTCMVRAYRVEALKLLRFHHDGMEAVPEMLLDAVCQKMRVVEVPATLKWSEERRSAGGRLRPSAIANRIVATFLLAFRHRPALWLAVPGLFPGLLPIVVAILLICRVSGMALGVGTAIIIVIQYTSLALFSGQLVTFVGRRIHYRKKQNGVITNGHQVPRRTA